MHLPFFLQALLIKLVGSFNVAIHTMLTAVRNLKLTDALQTAANEAVLAAQTTGLTGPEKFKLATAAVLKDFAWVAIPIIETAVQIGWAAYFGQAAAAPPVAPAPAQ